MSKKVSAFRWKELHKASILERLWQKNQGIILTEKLWLKASSFKGIKAVEGWMGYLTISNRPREEKFS
ncbi:MAG: hypothetical protein F6K17_26420 [Okeania sp. SIO3C4]|nr:hypothetical protein [Okeania sp. SIO3C4]